MPVGRTQRVRFGILHYCQFGTMQRSYVGIVVVPHTDLARLKTKFDLVRCPGMKVMHIGML